MAPPGASHGCNEKTLPKKPRLNNWHRVWWAKQWMPSWIKEQTAKPRRLSPLAGRAHSLPDDARSQQDPLQWVHLIWSGERLGVTLGHHSHFPKPRWAVCSSGNKIILLMRMEAQTSFPWLIGKQRPRWPGGISWLLVKPLILLPVDGHGPKLGVDCGGVGTRRREKMSWGNRVTSPWIHSASAVMWEVTLPGENSQELWIQCLQEQEKTQASAERDIFSLETNASYSAGRKAQPQPLPGADGGRWGFPWREDRLSALLARLLSRDLQPPGDRCSWSQATGAWRWDLTIVPALPQLGGLRALLWSHFRKRCLWG